MMGDCQHCHILSDSSFLCPHCGKNVAYVDGEAEAETVNDVPELEYAEQFAALTDKRNPWWRFWGDWN